MHEVRRAGAGEVEALARTLARAFRADPVSRYIFPDPSRRGIGLARVFAVQLSSTYLARGEVYATARCEAGAMWMPPIGRADPLADLLVQLRLAPRLRTRVVAAWRLAHLLGSVHPAVPHYYLATLGTDPAFQRRGLGSALLRPVLEHCDREQLPAYLESSREENVAFYTRHGFAVTGTVVAPGGGPRLWLMWRPPHPTRAGEALSRPSSRRG